MRSKRDLKALILAYDKRVKELGSKRDYLILCNLLVRYIKL